MHLSDKYIEQKGRFTVALSGGSTPGVLYQKLASEPHRNRIRWHSVHIFQVDERFVPRDHEDSNFLALNENLLKNIGIPGVNIHPVPVSKKTAPDAAREYEQIIRDFFLLPEGTFPVFDLILLGIGEDGHTASLFPDSDLLNDQHHIAAAATDKQHTHARITLSLPVLQHAENIAFLVSGREKAAVMQKVIQERNHSIPASLIKTANNTPILFIDEEAAQFLHKNV